MGDVVKFPRQGRGRTDDRPKNVLVKHAEDVAEIMGDDLDGFIVIGVDKTGASSVGWRNPPSMNVTLFAALLMEIVRRETVTQTEAVYVFNNQAGLPDDDDGA